MYKIIYQNRDVLVLCNPKSVTELNNIKHIVAKIFDLLNNIILFDLERFNKNSIY